MILRDTALLCRDKARSWTVSRAATAFAVALLGTLLLAPVAAAHHRGCARAHAPITATSRARLQRTVVCLINQQRRSRGLPALRENKRLNRSAQGWANVMVSHDVFSHGADFASRITAAGFRWSTVGENIATGFRTPAAVVHAWMASPGHCRNILDPQFRDVGTGVRDLAISGFASGGGTWAQDFGLPMGQPAASGNWGPADGCPYR